MRYLSSGVGRSVGVITIMNRSAVKIHAAASSRLPLKPLCSVRGIPQDRIEVGGAFLGLTTCKACLNVHVRIVFYSRVKRFREFSSCKS